MARHYCICPATSPCKDKATRREMERNKECPHTLPPLTEEDFKIGRMRPLSYSPAEVSKAIVRNVKLIGSDNMTSMQKNALRRLKQDVIWNIAQPENRANIWKWFGLIDDLFFGRLLRGFCCIEFVDDKEMTNRRGKLCVGYCELFAPGKRLDPKLTVPYCLIVFLKLSDKPLDRIGSYISTLCHEMIHSIFQLHTCNCQRCSNDIQRWGHGSIWQAPALAIEKAFASETVLGWNIGFRRELGMARDTLEGEVMEDAEALQELEIDIEKVKSNVERLRKQAAKREASRVKKP